MIKMQIACTRLSCNKNVSEVCGVLPQQPIKLATHGVCCRAQQPQLKHTDWWFTLRPLLQCQALVIYGIQIGGRSLEHNINANLSLLSIKQLGLHWERLFRAAP